MQRQWHFFAFSWKFPSNVLWFCRTALSADQNDPNPVLPDIQTASCAGNDRLCGRDKWEKQFQLLLKVIGIYKDFIWYALMTHLTIFPSMRRSFHSAERLLKATPNLRDWCCKKSKFIDSREFQWCSPKYQFANGCCIFVLSWSILTLTTISLINSTTLPKLITLIQNRRQKGFNRDLCSSAWGGLCVCAGGIDIIKLPKIPLIYSVSNSIWGGLEICLGAKPTKAPPWRRGCLDIDVNSCKHQCCIFNDLHSKTFCSRNTKRWAESTAVFSGMGVGRIVPREEPPVDYCKNFVGFCQKRWHLVFPSRN